MPDRYDDTSEYNWLMEQIMIHEAAQAMSLGRLLYRHLKPRDVIDFGCGPGVYLLPFVHEGCVVRGIDGASAAGECLRRDQFSLVDLRMPWHSGWSRPADLGLCIEVAEHIKPEYADILIKTITDNCNTIYFSGAKVGQGGEGHYNEQEKGYWIEKFNSRGFSVHPLNYEIQAEIHDFAGDGGVYGHCHWLDWNGMLLGRV